MKPYYQDEAVTLYHGDCREIMSMLDAGMVVVTDQPYGTGWVRGGGKVGEFKPKHEKPNWDVWSTSWVSQLNRPKRIAAFYPIARHLEMSRLLEAPVTLRYRKSNVRPGGFDWEPIAVSPLPENKGSWEFLAYNGDMPLHPCQKPMEIMLWLVSLVSVPSNIILDPFAGSGTTGRACKDLGRKCVMIEREEKYCEIAARRMGQEVLQFT